LIVLEFVSIIQAAQRTEITYTYPTNKIHNTEALKFATENKKKKYEFCALSCDIEFEIMNKKEGIMLSCCHSSSKQLIFYAYSYRDDPLCIQIIN
jgi:hypothetical protein